MSMFGGNCMDFFDSVNEIIENQIYEVAKDEVKILKDNVPFELFEVCFEELMDVVFEISYKSLTQDYHDMKKDITISGTDKSERYEEFYNIVCSKNYLTKFNNKFPVLRYIIQSQVKSFLNYQLEIYKNYIEDKMKICSTFNKDFGNIKKIKCSFGDNHNGKSVAKIEFENGILIYKPRNLNNTLLFNSILTFITETTNDSIKFKSPLVTNGEDHAWQEFVEYKLCNSLDEARRYYYRCGIYLSIFYFLNTFDIHHENVICNGEYPALIDLETLCNGRTNNIYTITEGRDLLNGVLNTSFIPYVNPNGVFDLNISGILSEPDISKKMEKDVLVEDDELDLAYEKVNLAFSVSENVLGISTNEQLNMNEVKDYLLKGFDTGCKCVLGNKIKYINCIENFMKDKELIFRQLLRPTQVYHQFVEASYHPNMVKCHENYDELFDILIKNFKPSKHGYLRVNYEIEELKKGCIPSFYCLKDSRHLYSNRNIICENYYVETILDTIKSKIVSFTPEALNYQKRLICMSLISSFEDKDFKEQEVNTCINSTKIDQDYIKNILKDIITEYKNATCKTGEDTSIIFIPQLTPNKKIFNILPVNFDLYQGGGMIWFIACYGKYMGDSEAELLSKKLLKGAIVNYYNNSQSSNDFSVFSGIGGLLYLTYNFYKITGEQEYLKNFNDICDKFFSNFKNHDFIKTDYDFLSGLSSTIYLLCNVYLDSHDENLLVKLKEVCDNYTKSVLKYDHNTIGLAHGISGINITLSSIYKLYKDEGIITIMDRLLKDENKLVENLDEIADTWCRGTSGILLSRYIMKKLLSSDDDNKNLLIREIEYLNDVIESNDLFDVDSMCLCHGIYGNIEIINYINKRENKSNYIDNIYNKYFNNFNELKWFDNFNYPLETFMLGNTGVAYVLLELLFPAPSILALEIYSGED